jgi:hypothetical protein
LVWQWQTVFYFQRFLQGCINIHVCYTCYSWLNQKNLQHTRKAAH